MYQLLAIEWMKVKKYRTFWIMIGMFVVLLPLWNYGVSNSILKINDKSNIDILDKAFTFSKVWGNLGWWTSIFVVFITILAVIVTTNEFTFKTHRQHIIDGLTRMQFFHAKWLLIILFAVATTLYVFILGLAFGLSGDSFSNFPGEIEKLWYVFVLSLNYYAFGMLLGILFKRSGIAIGLFFLYFMIIEKLIQSVIFFFLKSSAGTYLPLQASDELLPFPMMAMAKTLTGIEEPTNYNYYVLASFGWIIIYYIIGRFRLVKSDW